MKKILSMLLSIAMLLSLSVTAFAADDTSVGVIGGADGPTSLLISPNPGAVLETPDLENMTEAELDAYFAQLEAQYEAEMAAMAAEQKAQMIAAAKSLMPYKTGVNVWLNGAYMTFTDAVPVVKEGRTQVPFRAILEGLGATVSYDAGKIDAVFADGSVMKLAIGSKVMTYAYGENNAELTTVNMDVAPFIDKATGRTYVPARFIGETLGLTVTWDPELWVAYIVDWDALEAEIDGQFTKINEMLALSVSAQLDETKTYKSTDSITLSGVLDGQSKDPFEISLKGTGLTQGQNMSGSYEIGIDMGGYKSLIEAEGAEMEAALDVIDGQTVDMIIHAENGVFLRSDLINLLTGGMVAENGWLEVVGMEDMKALYTEAGINMDNLVTQATAPGFTMGKLVRVMCEDGELGRAMGYMAPDSTGRMFTAIYAAMLGDEQIKVTGSSSKTYKCTFDETDLLDAMVNAGFFAAEDADAAKDMFKEMGMNVDFAMTMTARNGKITKSTADMTMAMTGVKMTMDVEGTTTSSKGSMVLDIDEVGKFELEFTSRISTSKDAPLSGPTAGEQVVTLQELINAFAGTLVE